MSSSGAYSPGISSGSSGSSSCSGGCFDEDGVKYQYLSGYMVAHMLPIASYRYVYIMWFGIVVVSIILGASHMLGVGDRTYIGAVWKRFATKNRIYKVGKRVDIYGNPISKDLNGTNRNLAPAKARRIFTFPSFGRIALLMCMIGIPTILTLVGADFIGPNVSVFDLAQSWPGQTSDLVGLSRRTLHKRLQWGQGSYPRVTTYPPTRTLPYRTWWTTGVRAGDITLAMIPIVVCMAMKQVPFALFSTRLFGNYAFDRLVFLHKWGGRIIWLFATVHLVTWTVQLNLDTRAGAGDRVWTFVFRWIKFRWGWASYGFLTAMTFLSIGPIRKRFYEWFYIGHIITVVGFLVCAMLHHPPLAIWIYIPLAWWFADRLTRALKVAWVNGLGFAGRKPQFARTPKAAQDPAYAQHGTQTHPVFSDRYAAETPTRARFTPPSSIPVLSHKGAEYEDTLVGSMGDKRNSKFSEPSNHGVHRLSTEDDHPLAYHQPLTHHALTADYVDRRTTRLSSRYDLVDELIQEYVPSSDTPGEAQLNHAYLHEQSAYPSDHFAPHDTVKYDLEDPSDTRDPYSQVPSMTNPQYPNSRPMRAGAVAARPFTAFSTMTTGSMPRQLRPRPAMSADVAALIRPGFAFIQLLPGKTLRLTLRTPNKMSWKPGQWVYLNVPGVRRFQTHPFTIASAHDADFPVSTEFNDVDEEKGHANIVRAKGEERTIVLLIRCRKGFTKALYDHVAAKRQEQIHAAADAHQQAIRFGMPGATPIPMLGKDTTGVHVRSIIDGPFGSADRTHWNIHSSIVIICGGSGVSFGIAVLEHLCACLSGRAALGPDGKGGSKMVTDRVRFVWIVREFAHLQWIASALRRCIEMVTPEQLQVDLYVTHFNHASAITASGSVGTMDGLLNASSIAPAAAEPLEQDNWGTMDEPYSHDIAMRAARFTEGPEQEEYEITANDLTHFEGEDESAPTAAEEAINKRIRTEGKLRRANTRRKTMMKRGGRKIRQSFGESRRPSITAQSQQADNKSKPTYTPTNELPITSVHRDLVRGEQDMRNGSVDLSSMPRRPSTDFQQGYGRTRDDSRAKPMFTSPFGLTVPQSATNSSFGGPNAYVTPDHSVPGTRRGSAQSTYGHPFHNAPGSYNMGTYTLDPLLRDRQPGYPVSGRPSGVDETLNIPHISTSNLLAAAAPPGTTVHSPVDDAPIDLNDDEDRDLRVIAELAKPGHPKLDRIIRQEVESSHGRTLIATCGPKSLDIVLRSIVSKQIDPAKVRKGDLRGIVNIVSECFEWGG